MPGSCSSRSTTFSPAGGALQQRNNSDEARKRNHWRAAVDGKGDEMNSVYASG
jgi:hypothetical protein